MACLYQLRTTAAAGLLRGVKSVASYTEGTLSHTHQKTPTHHGSPAKRARTV